MGSSIVSSPISDAFGLGWWSSKGIEKLRYDLKTTISIIIVVMCILVAAYLLALAGIVGLID